MLSYPAVSDLVQRYQFNPAGTVRIPYDLLPAIDVTYRDRYSVSGGGMFNAQDRTWLDRSVFLEGGLQSEVYFLVGKAFSNSLKDGEEVEWLPSTRAAECIPELAAYYKRLSGSSLRHASEDDAHLFWMRLVLNGGDTGIGFPWYDTWNEMEYFLHWASSAGNGASWSDIDQGWEMVAVRSGGRFHLYQGDGEGEDHLNVTVDRDVFLNSVAAVRERMPVLIGQLSEQVGADRWTGRHR